MPDTPSIELPPTPTSTTAFLDHHSPSHSPQSPTHSPNTQKQSWKSYAQKKWIRNQGMLLILLSELFGALMITSARLLQNGTAERGGGMLTLQIIFVRFSLTLVLSTLYMWYTNVPDFPWGKREIRWLLILRGLGGFFGVFGFYYSVKYLPIAEAVVLSFFTPLLTAYLCSLFLGTPFTTRQLLGGVLCLFGVILIARPDSLFHLSDPDPSNPPLDPTNPSPTPPAKRLLAILLGIAACFGAAAVYTIIRIIGPRAHALISVNYYAIIASLGSFILLLVLPGVGFQLPADFREWVLLLSMGVYGFLLQFLMTKGLQLERGSRGTNMMYSQIVFALLLDWGIWGVWPTVWSWVGGAVVVGSSIWVAMQDGGGEGEKGKVVDEEEGMLGRDEDGDEEVEVFGDRDEMVDEEDSR